VPAEWSDAVTHPREVGPADGHTALVVGVEAYASHAPVVQTTEFLVADTHVEGHDSAGPVWRLGV
jgi:hypothetical protein